MSDLPAPLTPADCDLRGFAFMPMDTIRLLDSDLFALSTGDEFKAALALWCKSWAQIPAGSLPTDDRILAHLSGTGSGWRKLKEMALRNWIECADGRLYHPVVAEKALEAWDRREEWTEKQDGKTERQRRWRERQKLLSAQLREKGITPPKGASLEVLERLLEDARVDGGASTSASTVDAGEMPKTGTGTGTGTIPPTPKPVSPISREVAAVMKAGGMATMPNDTGLLREWLALPEMQLERDILPVVRRVAESEMGRTGRAPFKFKLFDAAIRQQHDEDQASIEALRRTRERIAADTQRQADEQAQQAAEDRRWQAERAAQ